MWIKPFLLLLFFLLAGCIEPASQNPPDELPETLSLPASAEEKSDTTENESETISDVPLPEVLTPEEQYWEERIDAAFAPIECPLPPTVDYPDSYYAGPMMDAHIHIPSIPDSGPGSESEWTEEKLHPLMGVNITLSDFACTFAYEKTKKVLAFFSVWDPVEEYQLEMVKQTMEEYPETFVPFIMTPDHDDNPNGFPTVDAETLDAFLNMHPGLFRGYGEIGLYARKGGSPALSPDSERMQAIYPIVRKHNLVVYFHLGEGMQEAFEKVLDENPDITFIFHGDQLIPYENGVQNLSAIDEILSNHPNVYYGVDELYGDDFLLNPETSKETFLAHFEEYGPLLEEDVETWKAFIEKHADQVLWDTDRGWSAPWSLDRDVGMQLTDYTRAFIGKLHPSVQEKYAYKNAEKLFGMAPAEESE